MKRLIILIFIVGSVKVQAQFIDTGNPPDAPSIEDFRTYTPVQITALTNYYKRPFNVISYNLYMDWRTPLAGMSFVYPGVNTITLTVDSAGLASVLLDAGGMRIDSIRVNGASIAPVQPDSATETLLIPVGARTPLAIQSLSKSDTRIRLLRLRVFIFMTKARCITATRRPSGLPILCPNRSTPIGGCHAWICPTIRRSRRFALPCRLVSLSVPTGCCNR